MVVLPELAVVLVAMAELRWLAEMEAQEESALPAEAAEAVVAVALERVRAALGALAAAVVTLELTGLAPSPTVVAAVEAGVTELGGWSLTPMVALVAMEVTPRALAERMEALGRRESLPTVVTAAAGAAVGEETTLAPALREQGGLAEQVRAGRQPGEVLVALDRQAGAAPSFSLEAMAWTSQGPVLSEPGSAPSMAIFL